MPEALKLIAKVTTGSLRDAENLLEQLVTYYGNKIELHQVQEMLGISGDMRIRELARHIVNKDITAGLKTINSVSSDGLDLRQFNRELVDYLRDLLLVRSGSEEVVDVTSDDLIEIKELAAGASLDYLLAAVKRFGEIDLRLDNYSPLPLELALVDSILFTVDRQLVQPKQSESKEPAAVASRPAKPAKPTKPAPKVKAQAPTESAETEAAPSEIAETPEVTSSPEIEGLRDRWKDFVNAMRGEGSKGNLDAFLRSSCEPLAIEDNTLVLGFYHKFHKEYIEDPKYKHLVEKKLKEVFGRSYQVRCVLTSPSEKAKAKAEAESPLVKAAKESYGATVVGRKPRMEEE
jgi:DNA polymerase-3 subunit gamma/tau